MSKPPKTHGGKREGSGRKPDWLKEKCRNLLDKNKLLEYLAKVASGDETEQRVTVVREGNEAHTEVVEVKCSTHDRLHAIELLLERGFGRPAQEMVHTGDVQGRFVLVCPEAKK